METSRHNSKQQKAAGWWEAQEDILYEYISELHTELLQESRLWRIGARYCTEWLSIEKVRDWLTEADGASRLWKKVVPRE